MISPIPRKENIALEPDAAEAEVRKDEPQAKPLEQVRPVVAQPGLGAQMVALARYMTRTEVHTYAFSVAANTILSLFPFIVLLLTLSRVLFRSRAMEGVVGQMMKSFLPTGQDFIIRNMQLLSHPKPGTQWFSLAMLLITSTGVFLPLEVALNSVWGVKENRSYLHNQAVSLGLAFGVGALAMLSVAGAAGQQKMLAWLFLGHTDGAAFHWVTFGLMKFFSLAAGILLFFMVYWVLPNRKIPALAVLPTAAAVGLLWEMAKFAYVRALPWLDFQGVYGPFYISVGLMMWAFLSGLLLLGGSAFFGNALCSEAGARGGTGGREAR